MKGQLKIQEMAFVLLAIMVLFGIIFLFYASVRFSGLREDAEILRGDAARELVLQIAGTPEFSWPDCTNCIDLDKAFIMKNRDSYKGFWELDHLSIEIVYPENSGLECTRANYPACDKISIINKSSSIGSPESAFVSLCRYEFEDGGYRRCLLGKIYASGRGINE